ncbi:MAG: DNA mismatch repair endonuclease MutL [Bryobacterales bacterium]|nr:DNA mismatch repair endonuclease MutL [Bryobacterales bacterium]
MGRIRILSDEIANKIAAGEVVERPASVAKELLENALDAGATEIRVEAEAGGSRLLKISDNGHGMGRDDAMLAFERHSTSKLREAEDLASIHTLGFRGEALPSIAAVSRLTLISRDRNSDAGTVVQINGGRVRRCEDIATPVGTSISVADLFYNVPARKKFLRSEQTELAHIGTLLTHYSLAHPEKSFELRHEGRVLLDVSPVLTLGERLYQVFGGQTLKELVDLGEHARELSVTPPLPPPWKRTAGDAPPKPELKQFTLRGYISGPHIQKANRNAIYLFVNGRLIRDKLIMHALNSAYHNLIPRDAYPFAALFLECPADEVDVNVHPAKTEVRFHHRTFVHDFIQDTLRDCLMANRPTAPAPAPTVMGDMRPHERTASTEERDSAMDATGATEGPAPSLEARIPGGSPIDFRSPAQPGSHLPYTEFSQRELEAAFASRIDFSPETHGGSPSATHYSAPMFGGKVAQSGYHPPLQFGEFSLKQQPGPMPRLPFSRGGEASQDGAPSPDIDATPLAGFESESAAAAYRELASLESRNLEALRDLRPIGQLKNSFIIAVDEEGLWLIDQHIAHERILFEKVLESFARGKMESQRLLIPLVVELSAGAQLDYASIEGELRALGFDTEPFGPRTISVKAAPADLPFSEIEALIREVLERPDADWRTRSPEDIRRELAASMACKASIKINTPLEQTKMEWLLRTLAETRYPMTCPHGRPIALRYATNDILKAFHRI